MENVQAAKQNLPPHSFEAESAVLGGLIISEGDPSIVEDCVNTGLTPSDFWVKSFQETYQAILDLLSEGKPIDPVILKDTLVTRHVINDAFNIEQFAQLMVTVPTASNTGAYAKIIHGHSIKRQIIRKIQEAGRKTAEGIELNGELDEIAKLSKQLDTPYEKMLATPANELFATINDEVEFILYPILARGCLTQLQGDPKSGKSCFSILIAIACATGRWVSGRFGYEAEKPSRVVYISFEDNNRRLKRRCHEYMGALGLTEPPSNLLLFGKNPEIDLSTKSGEAKLRKIIEDNQADLIILDTLSYLHSAEENSKKEMQPVMAALRRIVEDYPVSVLMIHHTRKGGTNGDQTTTAQRGRGSSAIAAAPDIILDWGNRPYPNVTRCALESKETTKGVGREFDVHYKEQDDGTVQWEVLSQLMENEKKSEGKLKVLEVIESLIKTSPEGVTISSVGVILGDIKHRTLSAYFKELERAKKVHQTPIIGARGARYYKLGPATLPVI